MVFNILKITSPTENKWICTYYIYIFVIANKSRLYLLASIKFIIGLFILLTFLNRAFIVHAINTNGYVSKVLINHHNRVINLETCEKCQHSPKIRKTIIHSTFRLNLRQKFVFTPIKQLGNHAVGIQQFN